MVGAVGLHELLKPEGLGSYHEEAEGVNQQSRSPQERIRKEGGKNEGGEDGR